ncbi:MAG: gliding motility-associated C-terminal domain-containing protein, partial [Prevotellaceae bacterium]|nr:gliding motility-associated C-terminal domain-containing protein [Prevotellaceae bacterium]
DGTEEVAAEDLLQWSKTFTEDTHTISMMVRDENDDTDTLTVLFTVNIRKIELGDTAICREQSIELKVRNPSDQLTYRWYSDAAFSGFIQQGTPVTAPLTSDTVFYVEAISNIGCSIRDSMKVNIYPVTDLTVKDIDVCNDFTAKPKASSANAVSLQWYGDPNYSNLIISADSFETAKLNRDTVFYVEAVSANGCITRDTVKITVYDVRMDDLSVCYDATAVISAPPVDISSLTWYRNPDYSDAITHALSFETAKLKVDTAFYLEALSAKGCLAKNFVKVTVNPLPELITADTSICAETETTFTVAGNAAMLNWYSDAAYYHRVVQALSYTTALSADAVFYVEALSNEGCITRDSLGVSVTPPPSVRAMDDSYLCHGEEITLTVLQSDGLVNWNVGSTKLKPESTREYTVTASRPPCPDVSDNVMITVGDSLHILPPVLPPYTPYADYFVQLTTNAESPDYSIIKGNLPFGLSLGRSGDLSGVPNGDDSVSAFTVQLEDVHNCIVTREYTVERDFYIPRMFTPNGDGINDVFMPGCEVTVFDRLGMEIFKGDNGWDGTYNNKLVSRDIYFYILNRKLENGTIRVYNGYIGVR